MEEVNEELKVKPHRNRHGSNTRSNKLAIRRARYRLGTKLNRTPTREEIIAELENPTFRGYTPINDPGRISRKERREKLKNAWREENPITERKMTDEKGKYRVNRLEMFIAEFFDYNLLNIAGETSYAENLKFTSNEHYLEKFTDDEFYALTLIKNDLPRLIDELFKLIDKHQRERINLKRRGTRDRSGEYKKYKKRKPKKPDPKPDLSDRRDII